MSKGNVQLSEAQELLNELFLIRDNFNPDENKKVKDKLLKYAKNNENDLQIRDALIILETFEIEHNYDDHKTCYKLSIPIFERLKNTHEWDFYDIRILTCVVHYAETASQAHNIATEALEKLENYSHEQRYTIIKLSILLNMTMRLLRARFSDRDSKEKYKNLEDVFSMYIDSILLLCDKRKKLILYKAIATVRKGLFYEDAATMNQAFKLLSDKKQYESYKILQDEVKAYKVHVDLSKVDKKQFRVLVGANIRNIRNSRGLTIDDLANVLGVTPGFMGLIERGERGTSSYALLKLSEAFGIPFENFYYGTEAILDSDNKKVLLNKITAMIKPLSEDRLELALEIVKGLGQLK